MIRNFTNEEIDGIKNVTLQYVKSTEDRQALIASLLMSAWAWQIDPDIHESECNLEHALYRRLKEMSNYEEN